MGIFDRVLIVSDLDGTLTDSTGKISEGNREAVGYFCAEGGSFSIATSRPRQTFDNLLEIAPFNAPIIHSNGSLIYDHAAGRTVFADYLDGTALELCREAIRSFPKVCLEIFTDERSYVVNPSGMTTQYHLKTGAKDIVIAEPGEVEESWIKLAITCDDREPLLDLRSHLERLFPGAKYTFSSPRYLEVLQHGVDKGFGTLKLAEHLGVARDDIYTAGNFDNDADLLSVAAVSFAPGNSSENILAMADVILPDNDHDPFAELIGRLQKIYNDRGGKI